MLKTILVIGALIVILGVTWTPGVTWTSAKNRKKDTKQDREDN